MIEQLIPYLFSFVAALIALTVHEYCHGYAAYKLGDNTARNLGRLSLNPLHHLDLFGVLCMVLFHFGWAKPVPINTRFFKNPKRDMAFTALAGPLSNFILSFLTIPVYLLIWKAHAAVLASSASTFLLILLAFLFQFFVLVHQISLGLGLFNLIPIPPLDGSRILFAFLPDRYYYKVMMYERQISLILLLALLFGARFGFLSTVGNFISESMANVWQLIPIFR